MPTDREREYYRMGFNDGRKVKRQDPIEDPYLAALGYEGKGGLYRVPKKKRKLSAWNKFVKANSKKPRFVLRSGKLNLKKMGVAFRKTPLGKKKRR